MKTSKAIRVVPITQTDPKIQFVLAPMNKKWRERKGKPGGSCGKARRGRQLQSLSGISRCCLGRTREKAASTGSLSVCLAPSSGNVSDTTFLWWGTSPRSVRCLNTAKRESPNTVKLRRSEESGPRQGVQSWLPRATSTLWFPRRVERHSCMLLTFRHDQSGRFLFPFSRERAQRKGNRPLSSCGTR